MTTRALARQLKAFGEGRALPSGETLHLPVAADARIQTLAFVRMGGESVPWAVGIGAPGGARQIFTIAEPRNRTVLARMLANVAPLIMHHMERAAAAKGVDDLYQVWVPNDSHVEMLHYLAYRYAFARRGEPGIVRELNRLGRASNWLFQEAQRPGETILISATAALREAYTFPADEVRQQHLGFLLGWLGTGDGLAREARAVAAERQSVSTSLEPAIERDELEPAVERWNAIDRGGGTAAEKRGIETRIRDVLTREIARRLDLIDETVGHLRSDGRRPSGGVAELATTAIARLRDELPVIERGSFEIDGRRRYVTSPDTDLHPQVAAGRFFDLEEAHDAWVSLLIHDDREMQADAIAEGDAFRGTITAVHDTHGRGHDTVWIVESTSDGPLRLRDGSLVCIAGCKKREARIVNIENIPTGGRRFELRITSGKRACAGLDRAWPAAHEPSHVGMEVTFVETYPSEVHRRRKVALWRNGKPGEWVHLLGRQPVAETATAEDDE